MGLNNLGSPSAGTPAFVARVLGAIAAWFGGRFGTVQPTITAFRERLQAGRL